MKIKGKTHADKSHDSWVNLLVHILMVLLLIAVIYIVVDKHVDGINKRCEEEKEAVFNNGFNQGFEGAVLQLLQQGQTCKPIPVTARNYTLNFLAIECLQQAQESQNTVELQEVE